MPRFLGVANLSLGPWYIRGLRTALGVWLDRTPAHVGKASSAATRRERVLRAARFRAGARGVWHPLLQRTNRKVGYGARVSRPMAARRPQASGVSVHPAQFARPVLGRPLLLEQRHDIAALVVAAHDYLPLRFERRRRKIDFATSSGRWHDLIAIDGKTSRRTHDTVGPKRRNPLPETTSEQDRLDAVDQRPQPALAWDTEMRRRESSQKIQMILAPGDDVVEIVTRGDRGAGQKQESLPGDSRPARVPGRRRSARNASGEPPSAPAASPLRKSPHDHPRIIDPGNHEPPVKEKSPPPAR